ncbi:hypothetical protein CLOSB_49920 [Clostridium beijerinckii]|nr:hypothetical protein CLOSB_49920 [Clostridium beijerinckii]
MKAYIITNNIEDSAFNVGNNAVLISKITLDISITIFPPNFTIHFPKITAAISQANDMGASDKPDILALYPSTFCMYIGR